MQIMHPRRGIPVVVDWPGVAPMVGRSVATTQMDDPPKRNPFAGANAGYLPLSGVILGFGGGWLIDRASGTLPLWTLVLGVVFTIAGFYHMMREAKR